MSIKGSCHCRALTYEVDGALVPLGHCHCSICRKVHGAAFATWAGVDPAEFRWTSGTQTLAKYTSSPRTERCFCRNCGSPLVVMHAGKIGELVMASVDGDPGARPREHIFVGSKAPWYEITDALPQHEGWPPGFAGA
jgi:hypothetical protein